MATFRVGLIGTVVVMIATIITLASCDGTAARDVGSVQLDGRWFHLELATDAQTRFTGLSGRDFIAEDGGMLFVFPRPQRLSFVMRDCPIPIDIIFLDATGRITAMHAMVPEDPRRDDEPKPANPTAFDAYEQRLTRYPSRAAAQFVIEIRGGLLEELNLSNGDKIKLDLDALKAAAK